jgi:hypothetical protein
MDFDYRYLIAFIFAGSAFFEAVTTRKLIQKLNDKIDAMDMRLLDMQSQVEEIVHEATAAKQVSLNAWEDAKSRHVEIISAVNNAQESR